MTKTEYRVVVLMESDKRPTLLTFEIVAYSIAEATYIVSRLLGHGTIPRVVSAYFEDQDYVTVIHVDGYDHHVRVSSGA